MIMCLTLAVFNTLISSPLEIMEDTIGCSSGEISVDAAIMAGGAVAVVVVCAEPALPEGVVAAAVEGAVEGVEGGVAAVLSFATAGPLSFFSPPPPPPAALPAAPSVGSSFEARMKGMYTNPPMYGTSTSGICTPSLS
jgi:hypothetical protein